jgi:hypothetical protein
MRGHDIKPVYGVTEANWKCNCGALFGGRGFEGYTHYESRGKIRPDGIDLALVFSKAESWLAPADTPMPTDYPPGGEWRSMRDYPDAVEG